MSVPLAQSVRPQGVHLVGSAPFETAAELFAAVGPALGSRLVRVPDGEPGVRRNWVGFQLGYLDRSPLVDIVPGAGIRGNPEARLRPGADAAELHFDDLGYATEAIAAHAALREAKAAGRLPAHVRLLVALPTPFDVLVGGIVGIASRRALEPAYEAALIVEVQRICAAIPHDELAIQWDLAMETLFWEDSFEAFNRSDWYEAAAAESYWGGRDGMVWRAAHVIEAVPADVECGLHICYGDARGEHDFRPADLANAVALTNALVAAVRRPVTFVHIPVPVEHTGAEFFAPLADLRLAVDTELYLGVVHLADGAEGTQARIAAAQSVVPRFGVATECGWGRSIEPDEVDALVRLHAAVSDPMTDATTTQEEGR